MTADEQRDRIDDLLAEMTLDERCSLMAGLNMWHTRGVERVGIPSVRLTDGPNGARGPFHTLEGNQTSACVPCATSLAASWDPTLAEEIGQLIGQEAQTKGSRVLLAPTVNLHRAPLAGRNFECYSEDPLLTGAMATSFILGAQSEGVACTVKHFIGNEAEHERNTMSSEIDERALRELYLPPFERAVREAGVLGIMTSYNRLNGEWLTEAPLLQDLVRDEWGFDGFVVTDWSGVGSTARSISAGLDLEMPGPGEFYGEHLAAAVRRGEVDEADVDRSVRRLLTVFGRVGALDEVPATPQSVDRPEHRATARRAAIAGTVLLRNQGVLPLDPATVRSIAVIGPNADDPTLSGGGAANFRPHGYTTPLDAIRARFPDADVRFEIGADRKSPPSVLRVPLHVRLAADPAAIPIAELAYPDACVMFPGAVPGTDGGPFDVRAAGEFEITDAGRYTIALTQNTPTLVHIDGALVVDGVTDPPPPGKVPWSSDPVLVDLDLSAGRHQLLVSSSGPAHDPEAHPVTGFTVGLRMAVGDDSVDRAVAAAASADVAVVVVGTDALWEAEFRDRPHLDLRGRQDELVERVCAANERTVVVLNTGAPVTLPWADRAPALLQVWFAGQEIGEALVDVITGEADPGGRLPTTFPERIEHSPSFGSFPGESGVHRYGEGVFVGYRWYASRKLPVRFPFGHGLSYTTFAIGTPTATGDVDALAVTVPVTNTGDRSGSEVVQLYVAPPRSRVPRPALELRAFAKMVLEPGESSSVILELDRRAFARWEPAFIDHNEHVRRGLVPSGPAAGRWVVDPGTYEVLIGRSSEDLAHRIPVDVDEQIGA